MGYKCTSKSIFTALHHSRIDTFTWNSIGHRLAPGSGSVVGGNVPGTIEKLNCCNKVARKIGTVESTKIFPRQILFPTNHQSSSVNTNFIILICKINIACETFSYLIQNESFSCPKKNFHSHQETVPAWKHPDLSNFLRSCEQSNGLRLS